MRPWITWLGLYQSLSIWLVRALSALGSQSATTPQVQIGGRPIASRIAAATKTKAMEKRRVRLRVTSKELGNAKRRAQPSAATGG